MALERVAPERRRQKRRARRVIEVHPTAEWLRAAAEEASATPPPHQEQRGRPGSARELANFEANLARVRPPCWLQLGGGDGLTQPESFSIPLSRDT